MYYYCFLVLVLTIKLTESLSVVAVFDVCVVIKSEHSGIFWGQWECLRGTQHIVNICLLSTIAVNTVRVDPVITVLLIDPF